MTDQEFLDHLAHELNNQDVRATNEPSYDVREVIMKDGVVDELADGVWYHMDNGEVLTPDEFEALPTPPCGRSYTRVNYQKVHTTVQSFLTMRAAQDYIDRNSHSLNKPYIYVSSGWDNPERVRLRKILASGNLRVTKSKEDHDRPRVY